MTKEQFRSAAFTKDTIISNGVHTGHISSVDFDFGVIHFSDDEKQCWFGYHYSKLKIMIDLEFVKKNVREGWKLNPNEKVVNGIIKGLNRCDGECPCVNDADDKICPCSNYRLHDKCCCTLYVKED